MRLVFAGTPAVAATSLNAVLGSTHEVVAVLTRPDAGSGRGRRTAESPVAQLAADNGIPVLKPARPSDPDFLAALGELHPDACPVVAYGALIPAAALAIPVHGWINLHFSLLPAWRGAAPVQHSILNGDDVTGATTFRLTEGLDTGPVYGVVTESVSRSDTAGAVLDRLAVSGAALLVATLDGIAKQTIEAREQAADGVSLAPKITSDDARIRWQEPAVAIDRRIRACTPAPGAWTTFRGERVKVAPLRIAKAPLPDLAAVAPGELVVTKRSVYVGTGTDALEFSTVQPPGKREMPAVDWIRGLRIQPGEFCS